MKKIALKINLLISMLAVSAGLIFFNCAFMGRLPKNVFVNGLNVGGKSRSVAAEIIRGGIIEELKQNSLTVYGKKRNYVFSYPEIGYKDNVQSLLRGITKGGEYTAEVSYYLNGIGEVAARICNAESVEVAEPYAVFNSSGQAFTYFEGNDGERADRGRLIADITASLKGDFCPVNVAFDKIYRTKSLESVQRDTCLLSSFTTYFDGDNESRSHNIALATSKINGTVLNRGDEFSFNNTVGQRTAEEGFRPAKIIENGEFVLGVGGGVCQVSTTMFNAALLAGCKITEFHPHSLAVSYVPPSFDAMVSGTRCDLKFVNDTQSTLYIRAVTGKNYVTFSLYGRDDGVKYGFSSVVTGSIEAPVEITEDSSRIKQGRDGIVSEGYLTVTRNGVKKTTLFRRDKYAPVKKVVLDSELPSQEEKIGSAD